MKIIPRATEKAYAEQTRRTYIFVAPRSASKQAIAEQVASEFKVTVTGIRTLTRKGKPTRFSRGKRAYPGTTYRQAKKYAYVTLKEGDKIPVFEEEDAKEAKTEQKPNKTAKLSEKLTRTKTEQKSGKSEKSAKAQKAEKSKKEDK